MSEVMLAEDLQQFLLILCVSLAVATIPQFVGWLNRIPYTLMLVIVGVGLTFADVQFVDLSPPVILLIFLPPLLFEASWNLRWKDLKQQLFPVSLYAVLGVVLSVVGVAFGLVQFAGLSIATALLVGACLSATDPVSVISLFKDLGVGKQLNTLTEGESLFNDGMAVVAFSFLVSFAVGETNLSLQPILKQVLLVFGIGIGMGCLIGFALSYLTKRFNLPLVEQSFTLVAAYGAYLLSEELGGSGVMATVTTGLILGNFGSRISMNPRTRMIVSEFWDFLAFFVNSIVFLLIGNQMKFESWFEVLPAIAVTIAALLVSRAVSIYGFGWLSNRLVNSQITLAEQTVLGWAGLRGSVSIALALSVPRMVSDRQEIISIVFSVVLFTLLVQGLTIKPLVAAFKLSGDQPIKKEYQNAVARQVALQRVLQHLRLEKRPGIDPEFYTQQKDLVKAELASLREKIDQLQNDHPSLREFAVEQFRDELLAIEAETYAEFVQAGQLNRQLDLMMENLES